MQLARMEKRKRSIHQHPINRIVDMGRILSRRQSPAAKIIQVRIFTKNRNDFT